MAGYDREYVLKCFSQSLCLTVFLSGVFIDPYFVKMENMVILLTLQYFGTSSSFFIFLHCLNNLSVVSDTVEYVTSLTSHS